MQTNTHSQCFSLGTFVLTEAKKLVLELQSFSSQMPAHFQNALSQMLASKCCAQFESHWLPIYNEKKLTMPDPILTLVGELAIVVNAFSSITYWLIGFLTMKHFKNLFPTCRIVLGKKTKGVMFGCTVLVLPNDNREDVLPVLDYFPSNKSDAWCQNACKKIVQEYAIHSSMPPCQQAEPGEYFVKMHGKGQHIELEFADSIANVDANELICYKILETMQLGPFAHFFSLSDSFLLIATRHIHARCIDGIVGRDFLKSDKGQKLHSLLSTNVEAFEQEAGLLIANLTRIHLLCEILGIGDVLTNRDNYFISPGTLEVVLVDFKYIQRRMFACNFISGETFTQCKNSLVKYTLASRNEQLRIALAVQLLNELETTIPVAIEKVLKELPQHATLIHKNFTKMPIFIREVRKRLLEYEPL